MNIYFLLEGKKTERKVYRAWLSYLLPGITEVKTYYQAEKNNFCLYSAGGYPSVTRNYLPLAIEHINETKKFQYLVICLDADEQSVSERGQEIDDVIQEKNLDTSGVNLVKMIQNRCIETWFLGNREIFNSEQPKPEQLQEYLNYYDVLQKDPELMGNYNQKYNHAQFHEKYLDTIFKAKGFKKYYKNNPGIVLDQDYLQELQKRVVENPEHLQTFSSFIKFCQEIKNIMYSKPKSN
ncbi:MAG: hypothetical protein AB4372_17160 [Xenococcus sp. (in: cyanobacteria)]